MQNEIGVIQNLLQQYSHQVYEGHAAETLFTASLWAIFGRTLYP